MAFLRLPLTALGVGVLVYGIVETQAVAILGGLILTVIGLFVLRD